MSEPAWYIGSAAVRQYLEVTGEPLSFDAATEKVTGICAAVRQKYERQPELKPRVLESGASVYRGPPPERLRLVVATDQVAAGRKPQLVNVLPGHSGFRRQPAR
jgi:hypothetical protein